MQYKRQKNNAFFKLVLLSMLLHGSAVVGYLYLIEVKKAPREKQAVAVQLRTQQKEPPTQDKVAEEELSPKESIAQEDLPQPEEHMPTHNSDEFASNNQDRDLEAKVLAGGGNKREEEKLTKVEKESLPTERESEEQERSTESEELNSEQTTAEAREVVTTTGNGVKTPIAESESMADSQTDSEVVSNRAIEEFSIDALPKLEELQIPADFLDGIGNLELLSDGQLSDTLVEHPFSESESKELKLVNRYLERMNKQVLSFWINPYKGNKLHRGIIKVELSSSGYLENAYIYRSSGHRLLDISVLDAIRAVPRYEVPDNEIITARYYTNLSFHYSSIEEETELMPFEQERAEVN